MRPEPDAGARGGPPDADADDGVASWARNPDPLGLDLQGRGMANARAHMTPFGPLPDPRWAGFFQALNDAGATKLVGGPSAPGSTQIRGQSLQPYSSPGTAGDALTRLQASFAPPDEGAAPPSPSAPPAPTAPSLPPPTGARPAQSRPEPGALPSGTTLGSLATQIGASPGLVTRYRNDPGSRRVSIDPYNPTAITESGTFPSGADAVSILRSRLRT